MATVKIVLFKTNRKKTSGSELEKYPLKLRIGHKSVKKYINLNFEMTEEEFDENKESVSRKFKNSGRANAVIQNKKSIALDTISELSIKVNSFTPEQLLEVVKNRIEEQYEDKKISKEVFRNDVFCTFIGEYSKLIIERYRKANRNSTANSYQTSVNALLKFTGKDIPFTQINKFLLDEFEAYWLGEGKKLGGLGVFLRGVRTIFNIAISDSKTEVEESHYPFAKNGYKIKKGRAPKRAMDESFVRAIEDLELKENTSTWHYKNYFLLTYYFHGMNFKDLAYLKRDCINEKEGRLRYERMKTRRGDNVKEFNIKIPKQVKETLKFYMSNEYHDNLLFPILDIVLRTSNDKNQELKRYKSKLSAYNEGLKKIAKMIGYEGKLTSYVVRHTFATIGLKKGASKTTMGEFLGHGSAVTSEAYFGDFDKSVLDEVADSIFE